MRHLVDAHHKVDGKHSIGHIAERAKGADAFPLRVAHAAHLGTAFVGQALAQVEQDVALTFGEGEARHARAHGGSHLGLDAIFGEHVAVVARTGSLIGVFAAIFLIVNGKCAGSRHQQQRAQLGASHTAEVDMGIAGEKGVVELVRGRPPTRVFVEAVFVTAHHIERHHRHQAVGTNGTGIASAEIRCADERIHIVNGLVLSHCRSSEARHSGKHGYDSIPHKGVSFLWLYKKLLFSGSVFFDADAYRMRPPQHHLRHKAKMLLRPTPVG